MASKENNTRKRALRDILAYENTLSIGVEKAFQAIRQRGELLQAELDKYINSLIHDVQNTFDEELVKIRQVVASLKEEAVEGNVTKTKASRTKTTPRPPTKPTLNVSQLSVVPDVTHESKDHFYTKELHYHDGETSKTLLKKLVGHYTLEAAKSIPLTPNTTCLESRIQVRSEVKCVRSFRVGDKGETVHAIATVDDDQAWICCGWGSRCITLFDRKGQQVKTKTLDIQINDATAFHDGHEEALLISSYKEKSIKRLNLESLRTTDLAYISLFPGGLTSDRQGNIYVCFRDNYQRQSAFGSRRMVTKLSQHGEILATMEKDEKQMNMFGYPFRIAVNNTNQDVCVSDYGDGTKGVAILDKDGAVKCWYKDPTTPKPKEQSFLPHGIVCDERGYILVSDWNNDCVRMLDAEGKFVTNLVTTKDGIEGPNALGLDKRGYLWIGDSQGVVRIFKYNLTED